MGIAKNIKAYTVYQNYNSDIEMFIQHLSNKLNTDFIVNIFDKDYDQIGEENRITSFGKQERIKLTITFDEYKTDGTTAELPTYEISIPINFIYEDSVKLTFYPNQSVHIRFLTFEHLWCTYIETLKFQSLYEDRKQAIIRYQVLRKEYSKILLKLGISQIFITTHAYYEIENITDYETYHKLTFSDIIKVAQDKDKLSFFDLLLILNTTDNTQLDKIFIDKPDLEILFLDTLKAK